MVPTLDELLHRLRKDILGKSSIREVCRQMAAGERDPKRKPLPENVQILAAQAMVILLDHVKDRTE